MGNFDVCKAQAEPQHIVGGKTVVNPDDKILELLKTGKVNSEEGKPQLYKPPCDQKTTVTIIDLSTGGFRISEQNDKVLREIEVLKDGTTYTYVRDIIKFDGGDIEFKLRSKSVQEKANFFGKDQKAVQRMERLLQQAQERLKK